MRPVWLLAAASLFATTADAAPMTFNAAVTQAEQSAPSLQARALDLKAARSASVAAGRLPDPRLAFGLEGLPASGSKIGQPFADQFSDLRLGLSQDVPSRAKRGAQRERARADIEAAAVGGGMEARTVRIAAAIAWLDLFYAEGRLAALGEVDHRLAILRGAASAQLASGAQRPGQSLEPERLSAALADRRADLVAAVSKSRAALARWTGDATAEVAGPPPAFAIDPVRLRAGLDDLPVLRSLDAGARQADADVALAQADKRPDWGWEVAYQRRDPRFGDMVMAQVSVGLPLFAATRQDPVIDARRSIALRVRMDRESARRELAAQLDADLADHAAREDRFRRSETVLTPLAERRAALETASYGAGSAGLNDVLTALLDLAEARIDRLDREADVAVDGARIALTYGSDPQ